METFNDNWEKEFDVFWGLAPQGTPKYEAGEKAKVFIRSLLSSHTRKIREEVEKARENNQRWTVYQQKIRNSMLDDILKVLSSYKCGSGMEKEVCQEMLLLGVGQERMCAKLQSECPGHNSKSEVASPREE
jgi:hypothetical protein